MRPAEAGWDEGGSEMTVPTEPPREQSRGRRGHRGQLLAVMAAAALLLSGCSTPLPHADPHTPPPSPAPQSNDADCSGLVCPSTP